MAARKNEEMSFEKALARLEEIVRALEDGSAPLDESLALFEEGVSFVKYCNSCLDKAEQKVKKLTVDENGAVEEIDFMKANESKND